MRRNSDSRCRNSRCFFAGIIAAVAPPMSHVQVKLDLRIIFVFVLVKFVGSSLCVAMCALRTLELQEHARVPMPVHS